MAIVYSHARRDERPSNCSSPRQAASNVSWKEVLGVLQRPGDPIAVQLQLTAMGVGELRERGLVAALGTRQTGVEQPLALPGGFGHLRTRHHIRAQFIGQFTHSTGVCTERQPSSKEES